MPLTSNRPIVDPRVMSLLGAHYPLRCTISEMVTTGVNSFNETIRALQPIADLTAIDCYLEPNTTGNDEKQTIVQVIVMGAYACALRGYYPTIDRRNTALVESVAYDIVDIAHDTFGTMTVLGLERINENNEQRYNG